MTGRSYLIWSIEHNAWWRASWFGYTEVLAEAGRYSEAEADEVLKRANYVAVHECKVPVDRVAPSVASDGDLRVALHESVKLQTHYAELLNMHDGGRRIGFATVEAWLARLRDTGTLPAEAPAAEGSDR